MIDASTLTGFRSLVFSLDALAVVMIYFLPKVVVRYPSSKSMGQLTTSYEDAEVPTMSVGTTYDKALPPLGPIGRFIASAISS